VRRLPPLRGGAFAYGFIECTGFGFWVALDTAPDSFGSGLFYK